MTTMSTRYRPQDLDAQPFPAGRLSKLAFDSGDLELRHYAPKGSDAQTPHDRDEIYVVISGTGFFRRGEECVAFAAGDVLFAAAHEPHRFEGFSADFSTWVMFYGPRKPAP